MNIVVKDTNNSISMDDKVFLCAYKQGLIHQTVVSYMNKNRQGNSAQKTRAEVRGGGRKPWRQKGTGRARVGSIRSPLWRGGGVIFAAKKRDYTQKINKKMYKLAMRSVISELYRQDKLVVLSEFNCETSKTKDFVKKMEALNLPEALIIVDEIHENEYLAARNVSQYYLCDTSTIELINLLSYEKILLTTAAIKNLEEKLQ